MNLKPQLAKDAQLDHVVYPVFVQPKIDGVRALNLTGTLTGRSMDPFKGIGITEYFSKPEFIGLDGEMILGTNPTADHLCSLTTGAMSRFKGESEMADLYWWTFDLIDETTKDLTYAERYAHLAEKVRNTDDSRIRLVPYEVCINRAELDAAIAKYAAHGLEGTMIRNPRAKYKPDRATLKGQEMWRVKPWGDFEILVTGLTEGQKNENEAKKNTLGHTERSSAQAGMVPNGQVGSIQGTLVADVKDHLGNTMFSAGLEITAGSGEMSVAEATDYFENQHKIVGHFAKIKHMTFGYKDLPRFPTFMSLRMAEDMS